MYLSRYEEKLLSGEFGEARALAMKVLVSIGTALGAQELVEISHAHVAGISYFNIGDAGLELINDLVHRGGRVSVFTSANPYMVLDDFLGSKHDDSAIDKQLAIVELLNRLGVSFYTCAPYNVRSPAYGEHLAWAESSAVLYANSVLGARTNKEGGPVALFAALAGRTYRSGVHLDDGRVPRVIVDAETPRSPLETSFLGLMIGELVGDRVAYVKGVKFLSGYDLKSFLSAIGTSSNTAMAVIEGVTPDYERLYRRAVPMERLSITYGELEGYVKAFMRGAGSGRGLYLIGCPHLSYHELIDVLAKLVAMAERVSRSDSFSDRALWITTHRAFVTQDVKGVLGRLSRYNIRIVTDSCAVVSRLERLGVDYVVTNSVKALSYISRLSRIPVIITGLEELISVYFLGLDSRVLSHRV